MAESSRICDVCQGFGEDRHPRGLLQTRVPENGAKESSYLYLHYPDVILLKNSASKNCQACQVILSCLEARKGNMQIDWETVFEEAKTSSPFRSIENFSLEEDDRESERLMKLARPSDDTDLLGLSWIEPHISGKGRIVLAMRNKYGAEPRHIAGLCTISVNVMSSKVLRRSLIYSASPST